MKLFLIAVSLNKYKKVSRAPLVGSLGGGRYRGKGRAGVGGWRGGGGGWREEGRRREWGRRKP